MFLQIPLLNAVCRFSMILENAAKLQARAKYEVENGNENFGCHSFVIRSFFLLLSPTIVSDKP
jgi:hypothetical protein